MGETIVVSGASSATNLALRSTAPLSYTNSPSSPAAPTGSSSSAAAPSNTDHSSSSHAAHRWAAIASFDGYLQVPLGLGDYVEISTSPFPLQHLNMHHPFLSNESLWLRSLTHKLHWNLTAKQLQLLEEQSWKARESELQQQQQNNNERGTAVLEDINRAAHGSNSNVPHTVLARELAASNQHNSDVPISSPTSKPTSDRFQFATTRLQSNM